MSWSVQKASATLSPQGLTCVRPGVSDFVCAGRVSGTPGRALTWS